jgi:hypothetical protein
LLLEALAAGSSYSDLALRFKQEFQNRIGLKIGDNSNPGRYGGQVWSGFRFEISADVESVPVKHLNFFKTTDSGNARCGDNVSARKNPQAGFDKQDLGFGLVQGFYDYCGAVEHRRNRSATQQDSVKLETQ